MQLYDHESNFKFWEIAEEHDYDLYISHEEIAWLDLHALDECEDPFESLVWIAYYNSKDFLENY